MYVYVVRVNKGDPFLWKTGFSLTHQRDIDSITLSTVLEYPSRAKDNFNALGRRARVIKIWSTGWAMSYPEDFQSFGWITFPKQ